LNNNPMPFWVSVRTLGEFVFCKRAGILSSLQPANEEEPEYAQANLDFLPQYSVPIIEEQLALRMRKLGTRSLWLLVVFVLGGVAWWYDWRLAVVAAAVVLFAVGRTFSRELRAVMALADYRREAIRAEPKEPPTNLSTTVAINWWELLKAGFDSIRLQEILKDEETKLAGKPWRVLRKGSLRIPVIKLESDNYRAGRFWIYPQHEIRLAAYAHLLATCEGGEVPYAIVLFGDTFDGIAFPITGELMADVLRQVKLARETIRGHSQDISTAPPANGKICSGCPFGYPVAAIEADLKNPANKVHGVTGRDGKLYHSECGDQFAWTPAHELAKKKGLVPPES
jgi:hypothetical protein